MTFMCFSPSRKPMVARSSERKNKLVQHSWPWLLMEHFRLSFAVPFGVLLGPCKLSVMLNYSETHISSVSKKSTPTGKKCHKWFIALSFKSGMRSRGWACLAVGRRSLFLHGCQVLLSAVSGLVGPQVEGLYLHSSIHLWL